MRLSLYRCAQTRMAKPKSRGAVAGNAGSLRLSRFRVLPGAGCRRRARYEGCGTNMDDKARARWRWHTPSAKRSRRLTGAETCSRNGGNSRKLGRAIARYRPRVTGWWRTAERELRFKIAADRLPDTAGPTSRAHPCGCSTGSYGEITTWQWPGERFTPAYNRGQRTPEPSHAAGGDGLRALGEGLGRETRSSRRLGEKTH